MDARLKELQQADSHIMGLEREKSRLDNGSSARAARDVVSSDLDVARKYLQDQESQKSAREDEQATAEAKIKQQQSRLMTASSTHQIEALQRDIEGFGRRRSELDEAILMLMDEIEGATSRVQVLAKQLAAHQANVSKIEETFRDESERIAASLKVQNGKRDELRGAIDAAALTKYDNSARKHSGVAVAWPVSGNCSGCGTELTPFNLKEARTQEWPTCENCGRFLLI
jgi:predicted  nucleic acid-binding Zn-ribbon protein